MYDNKLQVSNSVHIACVVPNHLSFLEKNMLSSLLILNMCLLKKLYVDDFINI